MSGRGRGKKGDKNVNVTADSDEEPGLTVLPVVKAKKARGQKTKNAKDVNAKKQPKDGGVVKKRPLKKKQSDRLLKAIVEGENIEQLKEMLKVFQTEDTEAQAKKEAKAKEKKA